ncbi:NADPH-dependent oxidoreductase [Helcococcus bovis]|uniref:NADPH-dependent oxidoreductase n=1 Tax=Helcococcus bovis TaxID=3153252 RepID=UPI0038BA45F4
MKTNKTIETILNHRSIRKWKDEKLSDDVLETLYNVANRTSTSIGMQTASIIRVVDKEKRAQIAEISTQKYVNEAPEFWIYVADNYRNHRILQEADAPEDHTNDVDRLFSSFTDAAIMAQNVANAAESLGLGIVYFGSILNDARKIVEILDLPEHTFPVVGMGIGYPDQDPQLKPRMNYENRIFTDSYQKYENYHEVFKEYDEEMVKYYDLRNANSPVDKFTEQAIAKYTKQQVKRQELLQVAKEQGFDLGDIK